MARMCIVTNNPLVAERLSPKWEVDYRKVGYTELLEWVRDFIQEGAVLLSHPLAGSVKPGETPYRSVLVQMPGSRAASGSGSANVEHAALDLRSLVEDDVGDEDLSEFQLHCDYLPKVPDSYALENRVVKATSFHAQCIGLTCAK